MPARCPRCGNSLADVLVEWADEEVRVRECGWCNEVIEVAERSHPDFRAEWAM